MATRRRGSHMSAQQKIAAGRKEVFEKAPYIHHGTLMLVPIERPGLPEKWAITDRMGFMYDPDYLASLSVEEVGAMLAKCVTHCFRQHGPRGERMHAKSDDEQRRWGGSTSMTVNFDLKEAGFKLPDEAILPDDRSFPRYLLPEEYTRMWEEEDQNDDGGDDGKGPRKPGDKNGQKEGTGWNTRQGSGGGNPIEDEPDVDDDELGRDPSEVEEGSQRMAEEIKKEAQKGRGHVPAGFERWADSVLAPPKVPWRAQLARAARNAVKRWKQGKVDYRFNGIGRKQAALGFGPGKPILPRLQEPVPKVDIAGDTSGSMGQRELEHVVEESGGVLKAVGADCRFFSCDATVHTVKQCRTAAEIGAALKGGGGTSFVPVFDLIKELPEKPDVLVFITDGCGDAPATPPPYEVIWVLVGPYKQRPFPQGGDWADENGRISWGTFIEVDDIDAD